MPQPAWTTTRVSYQAPGIASSETGALTWTEAYRMRTPTTRAASTSEIQILDAAVVNVVYMPGFMAGSGMP